MKRDRAIILHVVAIVLLLTFYVIRSPAQPRQSDSAIIQKLINAKPDLGNVPEGRWPQAGIVQLEPRQYELDTPINIPPGITIRGWDSETSLHIAKGPMFNFMSVSGNGAKRSVVEYLCVNVDKGDGVAIGSPQDSGGLEVRRVLFNTPNGTAVNFRNPSGNWTYNPLIERCIFFNVRQCVDILGENPTLFRNELGGGRPVSEENKALPEADFIIEGGWAGLVTGNHISPWRHVPLFKLKNTRVSFMGNAIEPSNNEKPGLPFIILDGADVTMDQTDSWPHAPGILKNGSTLFVQSRVYSAPIKLGWLSDGSCKVLVGGASQPVGSVR